MYWAIGICTVAAVAVVAGWMWLTRGVPSLDYDGY
jgi:hypothetical protein